MFYSVHDKVIVNLENAPVTITRFLRNKVPRFCVPRAGRDPDVIIKFVDTIPKAALEVAAPFAARRGTDFYYIDKFGACSTLPLSSFLDDQCSILTEHRMAPQTFYSFVLQGIIFFRLLMQDICFVHASAVAFDQTGILLPAWGGTGKTSLLVRFLEDGAQYLGDDLALLSKDGILYSYPTRIRMFYYNFDEFPKYCAYLGVRKRLLLHLQRLSQHVYAGAKKVMPSDSLFLALIARTAILFKNVAFCPLPVRQIGGEATKTAEQIPLQAVFLLTRVTSDSPSLSKCSSTELMERIIASVDEDYSYLNQQFRAYRFLCPERDLITLQNLLQRRFDILIGALTRTQTFHLRIPMDANSAEAYQLARSMVDRLN